MKLKPSLDTFSKALPRAQSEESEEQKESPMMEKLQIALGTKISTQIRFETTKSKLQASFLLKLKQT